VSIGTVPDPGAPDAGGTEETPAETKTTAIKAADRAPWERVTTKISRMGADEFHPDVPGMPRRTASSAAGRHQPGDPDLHLIAGAVVADGRYRLLVSHGGLPGLRFWQALDTALDRPVALTFIDPEGRLTDEEVGAILARTQVLSRIDRPGIARVLDVTETSSGGMVVSEWIRGGSLQEVADTAPSPIGAARAVQALAAAAAEAHSEGVSLSIDHPSRIRVSIDGDVALAFPATLAHATADDDVRGVGAALYALLLDRWPLPEPGDASGLRPAETGPAGEPVEPSAVNPEIPFQISAAAVRAVQIGGGIRSASTLLNLLQQATAAVDRTDLVAPVTPAGGSRDGAPIKEPLRDVAEVQARRRRSLLIGIGAGVAVLVVALVVFASVVGRLFGSIKSDRLGLNTITTGASAPAGEVVKPTAATVFSPQGGADAPDLAGLAIDGNPATAWPTDTYNDATPFPGFKNGVGLMLQLPKPTVVGGVTVTVSSTGTQIQIRSATSGTPSSLEDTVALTQPTALKPGANTIPVPNASPTSFVLVWISTLGQTDGKNRTDVSEITIRAAK